MGRDSIRDRDRSRDRVNIGPKTGVAASTASIVFTGRFKIHIDHMDNPGRDIWAVQVSGKYFTVRSQDLIIWAQSKLVPVGPNHRSQPRAYLEGYGRVRVDVIDSKRDLVRVRIRGRSSYQRHAPFQVSNLKHGRRH